MTTFESSGKKIYAGKKPVFGFLADMNNFTGLIPEGKITDFKLDRDGFRFSFDRFGEVEVRLISREPDNVLEFESEGGLPFRVDLRIDLEESDDSSTIMKLTLNAELNMMMSMMAKKPLEEGVEMVASIIADHLNSNNWS